MLLLPSLTLLFVGILTNTYHSHHDELINNLFLETLLDGEQEESER